MKFKSIYLSAALALFLASCGSSKKITATPLAINTTITAKKADLTDTQEKRWSHLDLLTDTIPGMSVDRTYNELLKDRKADKIIVGVIDSGVDIEHPDLQGVIWTNPKEVAGNGIDDDKNGYIDDVHGWNFLGDINHENMEFIRILKKGDDGSATYKRAKEKYDEEYNHALAGKMQMDYIQKADKTFQELTGKEDYTADDLKALDIKDPNLNGVRNQFVMILGEISRDELAKEVNSGVEHYTNELEYHLNLKYNARDILGDNPDDFSSKSYGNNNVIGPDKEGAKHGTHVSGIIAQVRNNGIGGDGVASNVVEIMAVRAVPDGDEYDKDVALAIRYAVDNGAKVINGSFGKYFSTHSDWVYDAIKYAGEKDVLIVCAAGNEGSFLDKNGGVERYPNDNMVTGPEISDNFICIGALNNKLTEEGLVAPFSNYGKNNVDVFSPGMRIYATTPDNHYEFLQGTSMASPNAAGVAALIRAYYPKLTASQVKHILMDSGLAPNMQVKVGEGEDEKVIMFSEASKSGKIVNAYNALIMADKISRGK